MAVTADIYVKDDTVVPAAIPGVIVSVLDSTTFAEVAQGVTDVNGKASFVLPGNVTPGLTYEVRFYKLGVRFANPVQIQVEEPVVTTNKFDFSGTLLTLPTATDPRVCRCTGIFKNFSNSPIVGAVVRFMAKAEAGTQIPKVVDGNLISAEVLATKTDEDGSVSVDLLRGGHYFVTFSGEDDVVWEIHVPDRSSVDLIELIHPGPVSLDWDDTDAPGDAITLAVGETKTVHYSVLFTNYESLTEGVLQYLDFTNGDDALISVAVGEGVAIICGLAAGSTTVTAAAKPDVLPIRVPDNSITAPALSVTVTP